MRHIPNEIYLNMYHYVLLANTMFLVIYYLQMTVCLPTGGYIYIYITMSDNNGFLSR